MTTFTGPLKVKQPFSETVNTTIDASGTSTFAGGPTTFATPIIASATAVMNGPLRVGTGTGGAAQGYVMLVQSVTVAHNNSAGNPRTIDLPVGADIIDFIVDVVDTFDAGSLGTAAVLEVGVSGSSQMLAVIAVSASTTPRPLASTMYSVTRKRWQSFTSKVGNGDASGRIQVFVTARTQQATAMTVGECYFSVVYVQRT